MAAGNPERRPRHQHPRAFNVTGLNRVPERDVGILRGSDITNRGEAGQQGCAGVAGPSQRSARTEIPSDL